MPKPEEQVAEQPVVEETTAEETKVEETPVADPAIGDLLDDFFPEAAGKEKEKSLDDATPAEEVQEKEEEQPVTEDASVAEVVDVQATEQSAEAAPSLDEVNKQLLAQIDEMSKKLLELGQGPEQPKVDPTVQKVQEQQTAEQQQTLQNADAVQFATEEEFAEALSSHDGLNKILNKVYQRAAFDVLRRIPTVVTSVTAQQVQIQRMVDDFYKVNDDLVPYANYVGYKTNQLQSAHPDWTYKQLFVEVEKEVRKDLKRQKAPVSKPVVQPKAVPVQTQTRRPVGQQLTKFEQELSELISD